MIDLTDSERGRLQQISGDPVAMEGLKKVFLKAFLQDAAGDVNVLAASRLAVEFLKDGFKELERLKYEELLSTQKKNPAV